MKSKTPRGFCPQCQSTTYGGASKCLYCGAELPRPTRDVSQWIPARLPKYFLLKFIVILVVLVYAGGILREQFRAPTAEELAPHFQAAVLREDYAEAEQLLTRGADPNLAPKGGEPTLLKAVGNRRMTNFLIENGAFAEVENHIGVTPLMKALWIGDFQTAKLLLDHAADANSYCPTYHASPLQIAVQQKAPRALISNLLRKGANVNVATERNVSVLMMAVQQGDLQLVKQLLAYGANVNRRGIVSDPITKSLIKMSSLDIARRNKRRDIEKILLDAQRKKRIEQSMRDETVELAAAL
jgi:ankyrin repeat protein